MSILIGSPKIGRLMYIGLFKVYQKMYSFEFPPENECSNHSGVAKIGFLFFSFSFHIYKLHFLR